MYIYLVSPRHTYILPSGLWCSHRWNCRWSPARDSKANFCQKPECNQNIKILMSDYTAQLFKGKAVSHEDKRDFVIERKPDFLRGRCCGSYLWNSLRGAVSYPEKKWLWQSSRIVPWYLTTTFYEHQKILQLFDTTWAHIQKIFFKVYHLVDIFCHHPVGDQEKWGAHDEPERWNNWNILLFFLHLCALERNQNFDWQRIWGF